jgi:hypothetical protein
MPTVLRWKGYRFFWYQADGAEPPHVHIWKDGKECKLWLGDSSMAFNHGFAQAELRELVAKTTEERAHLLGVWNEHFGQ